MSGNVIQFLMVKMTTFVAPFLRAISGAMDGRAGKAIWGALGTRAGRATTGAMARKGLKT